MTSPKYIQSAPVTVNPTSTSLGIVDVRDARLVAIYVKNLDAVQTLDVTVRRRAALGDDFSDSQVFEELTAIPPLTPKTIDFDCGVQAEIEVVGIASGGGLNATLTVKPDYGRRG